MTKPTELPSSNRRDFIKTTGSVTAASVLAGVAIPRVHSAVDDMTQIAIVGAGMMGHEHIRNIALLDNAEIVAIERAVKRQGAAALRGASLATRNVKDFAWTGVPVIDPWENEPQQNPQHPSQMPDR